MDNQELVKRLLRGISSYKALDERKYEFEYEDERYVIEPEIDGSFAIESGDVYDYTEDELPHILRVVNEMNSRCSNVKFICENNKIRISAIAFVAYSMHNQQLNFIEKERFPIVCESLVKDIVSAKEHLYYELPPKKGNGIKGKSWILWLILFLVAFFLLRSCFSCGGKSTASESPILNNTVSTMNSGEDYPFTAQRIVSESELASYSDKELDIMRNEIFARHGYIFKRSDLKEYFSTKSWYNPQYSNVNNMLSKTELKNVEIISKVEKKRK